ncbi:MAG: hypothetical protein ABIY50_09400 [Ignavibacteria bacterium]
MFRQEYREFILKNNPKNMNVIRKTDYLKFVFHKAKNDLARYNINNPDKELIDKLFGKLIRSENLLRDLFILSHVSEFKNIGKYFIFIVKKIEDDVINFENLSLNIQADTEYLENELLNYFSNPQLSKKSFFRNEDTSIADKDPEIEKPGNEIKEEVFFVNSDSVDTHEEPEIILFKKNYLELIQSDTNEEIVYELPETGKNTEENVYELPEQEDLGASSSESADDSTEEKNLDENHDEHQEEHPFNKEDIKSIAKDQTKVKFKESKETTPEAEVTLFAQTGQDKIIENKNDPETNEKIQLSEDIKEELKLFKEEQQEDQQEEQQEQQEQQEEEHEDELNGMFDDGASEQFAEETTPQPTNAAFIEYENEIKEKNSQLDKELDIMIYLVNAKPGDEDERNSLIKNITGISTHLEDISRKMSLEIISNIYQTLTLSFEKIADGKYDLAESTLNLFKKGLALVLSLIKGDDYFGYKDILKSIENIRYALIEEKEKRKLYINQLKEKQELENQLHQKYPDDTQKVKLGLIKQLVKDTAARLNSLDNITGEYQIYEALRSLSGSLTNFKEIVMLSKELKMKRMIQLAEASYIFIKFLQNYRINPVTIETKEIFGYIIYNLKSLVMGKEAEDVEVFISYLNDPVKIFSKKKS